MTAAARETGAPLASVARHARLFDPPAEDRLALVMRELWVDRIALGSVAFLIGLAWFLAAHGAFAAGAAFGPALFVTYEIAVPKPPMDELWRRVQRVARKVARVHRARAVVFGHTHQPEGVWEDGVFYGNTGSWSPAYKDLECREPLSDARPVVWLKSEGAALSGGLVTWRGGELRGARPRGGSRRVGTSPLPRPLLRWPQVLSPLRLVRILRRPRARGGLLRRARAPATALRRRSRPCPPSRPVRSPDWSTLQAEIETRTLDVRLKPGRDDTGEVDHVDVGIGFSERPGELGDPSPFVLQLAQAEGGETLWVDHITDLYARDAEGALTLRPVVVGGSAAGGSAVANPRAAVARGARGERETPAQRRHPHRLPRQGRARRPRAHPRHPRGGRRLRGDGRDLPPPARRAGPLHRAPRRGTSTARARERGGGQLSLGPGAAVTTTIAGLRDAVFMAGPIGRIDVSSRGARLTGAWLGATAFDPLDAIPWVMRAREAERRAAFHGGKAGAFSMVVRVVPEGRAAFLVEPRGAGLLFLPSEDLPFDRDAALRDRGRARAPRDRRDHQRRAPLLDGLADPPRAPDPALRARLATRRPRSPTICAGTAQHQGMLYAAELDAAVRAKGDGHRSLDDLVRALAERARAGAPLPAGTWRDVIGSEIGPEGQARYDAVIVRGEPAAPPLNAYGPCFKGERPAKRGAALVWRPDPKQPDAACSRTGTGPLRPRALAVSRCRRSGDRARRPLRARALGFPRRAVLGEETPMSEMAIGMIGLGVMGRNLSLNIEEKGFSVAAWDAWPEPVDSFVASAKGKQICVASTSYRRLRVEAAGASRGASSC